MRVPGILYVQGRNAYDDRDDKHYGFAIHNTSNDASARGEAAYAARRTDGTSSHFYVDPVEVVQSLDTNSKAGHAGSTNGNENSIAWEFTGTNDKSRAWWLANINWTEVGQVMAYIIKNDPDYQGFQVRRASVQEMKDNPKVKAFYGHDDMRRAWGGTSHTDPGPNFPWDMLFSSVNKALGGSAMATLDAEDLKNIGKAVWEQYNLGSSNNPVTGAKRINDIAVEVGTMDAEELAAIEAAAKAGAEQALTESVDEIVSGILEGLDPDDLNMDAIKAAVESGVRNVLIYGVAPNTVPPVEL